jgi:hypothetical protein
MMRLLEDAALAEQRMDAAFRRAGLKHPIVAQCFASGAQQREQDQRECVDKSAPITVLGRGSCPDPCRSAGPCCRQTALNFPATTIEAGELFGSGIGVGSSKRAWLDWVEKGRQTEPDAVLCRTVGCRRARTTRREWSGWVLARQARLAPARSKTQAPCRQPWS